MGAVLYAVAALGYLRLYRRRRARCSLAAVGAFVLLAEAMLAIGLGRNWHLTWWEWHLLMLLAFALVARAAWAEWQREGSPAEIWADLYEDATWGHDEEASVLFADLQGFTGYSEGHGESEVTAMLDAYFEAGIPAVRDEAATSARSATPSWRISRARSTSGASSSRPPLPGAYDGAGPSIPTGRVSAPASTRAG